MKYVNVLVTSAALTYSSHLFSPLACKLGLSLGDTWFRPLRGKGGSRSTQYIAISFAPEFVLILFDNKCLQSKASSYGFRLYPSILSMGQCLTTHTIGDCDTSLDQGFLAFSSDQNVYKGIKEEKCKTQKMEKNVDVSVEAKTVDHAELKVRKRLAVAAQAIHSLSDVTIQRFPKTQSCIQMLLKSMKGNILFEGVSLFAKQAIVESMGPVQVESGDTIIQEGEEGSEFFIVESGSFGIFKSDQAETERAVGSCGPGSGFGEIAVMYSSLRTATVRATSEGKLWKMERLIYQAIKMASMKHVEQRKNVALAGVPLLQSLPEETKGKIAEVMAMEEFNDGEYIIRQHEPGGKFYIIDQGNVTVVVDGESVATLSSGTYFGERALVHDEVRNADIIAEGFTTCFVIDRQSFQQFFDSLEHAWTFSVLRGTPVFASMSDVQLLQVAKCMKQIHVPSGQTIFKAGDPGRSFYIVEKGKCKIISLKGEDLAVCEKGNCFGELALLTNAPRKATVLALSEVLLLECSIEVFHKYLGDLRDLKNMWKIENLMKLPLFSKLSRNDLCDLAACLTEKTYEPGEIVFKQGDDGNSFYIIENGNCSVVKSQTGVKGQLKEIARLTSGQYFGERALLCEDPRAATIVAKTNLKLFELRRSDFFKRLKNVHDILSLHVGKINSLDSLCHIPEKLRKGDFTLIKPLGKGAFGKVYLVRCKINNKKYALKCIKKDKVISSRLTEHVIREKEVMEHIRSPFLVSLASSFQDATNLYMLMQVVEGGELFNYLSERSSPLKEEEARFYAGCVILGLEYLNDRGLCWRDLKPENILLDISGYAMLTDFGFSKSIPRGSKSFTMCGTPEYLAPEIVLQSGHTHSVDWWALGILIFEMVTGKPPFCNDDRVSLFKSITSVSYAMPDRFSEELKDLISNLLVRIPSKRLGSSSAGARAVKEHQWFRGFDWNALVNRDMKPPFIPSVEQRDLNISPRETWSFNANVVEANTSRGIFDRAFEGF